MILTGILTVAALVSVAFFPWPFSVFLAVLASFRDPLVPLAAGLLADALYYVPHEGSLPMFTFYGLLVSVMVAFVRRALRTSIM